MRLSLYTADASFRAQFEKMKILSEKLQPKSHCSFDAFLTGNVASTRDAYYLKKWPAMSGTPSFSCKLRVTKMRTWSASVCINTFPFGQLAVANSAN